MRLMNEIQALRAEIDARARSAQQERTASSPATPSVAEGADTQAGLESFVKTVDETLAEFSEDIGKYPQLAALAALGVGLAVGVVIGRQLR